jgi:deoxyribodipyrimidine photolyase-related protein
MSRAALIFPHQLFDDHPALTDGEQVILVEEPLFFRQYRFHRKKLILHRASMRRFAQRLRDRGHRVHLVPSSELPATADIAPWLKHHRITHVRYVDPCDDWLCSRLAAALANQQIASDVLEDPHFLTPRSVIADFVRGRQRLFFTEFYIFQRRRLNMLLTPDGKPVGGRWSFDTANRKRVPRHLPIPAPTPPEEPPEVRWACHSVRRDFPNALGDDTNFDYPIDHEAAANWLDEFLRHRLRDFGAYEDAISRDYDLLFHSRLTPLLNIGLLSPRQVVEAALRYKECVPLNSLEGFLRQVIGWREFIRLAYLTQGRRQRSRNFWKLTRPAPQAFYDGTTGIEPVDHVIRKVLRTGFCHHIERLMVLGNFMLLCDIHPNSVYQWFMELFIDAYDWVMVPNVYGMSQFADGGSITTKPYVSGSSYIRRMSDFPKGPWCETWDALYWRFIDRHAEFLAANPRMAMMVRQRDRLGDKLTRLKRTAEDFLKRLHGSPS